MVFTCGWVGSEIGRAQLAALPRGAIAVCDHDPRKVKEGPNTALRAQVLE